METDRTLGVGSKAVSSEPIMLSIRSKTVPNLTLVDMPGLTKVATADQPESIVRDIEEMARAFISPPNVVIVAVSPANADIATSVRDCTKCRRTPTVARNQMVSHPATYQLPGHVT